MTESVPALDLRVATLADLEAVWEIETSVFGADAWSREMMREELAADHRTYLVLIANGGEIVGYGGLLAVGTEADIQTIAVDPSFRGTGQGRRLMTALIDDAMERGVREVFLEVRADNPVAQRLYASLGFADIGVRPRYYQPDNVDAVIMRLDTRSRAALAPGTEGER
ncbi:ribosomal protein S18-alanine N-acetyltransferase [Leucobacter sp. NPDC058333]|uniref:ribosomal protein S18-alanine N-acetyltransferase n=1 Tax=Leucobacter sp. NPDC058333 TaxID=3346450 RepID=UPI00365A9EDC